MTRSAAPEIVACPKCDWYFARRALRSFSARHRKVFSDGGAKYGIEHFLPNEGRCPSCSLVIENINDLAAIPTQTERLKPSSRLTRIFKTLFGRLLDQEPIADCAYLERPRFEDYAELFAKATSTEEKHKWAVEACRSYHQMYCQPTPVNIDSAAAPVKEPEPFTVALYYDITCVLSNQTETIQEEYHLVCADIYRLRGEFDNALKQYELITDPALEWVVEQGRAWCQAGNVKLMELRC